MKKILSLSVLTLGLITSAQAGTASTSVPVNATVSPSCVFEGQAAALKFNYTAAAGIDNLSPGVSQILHCNFGTIIIGDAKFTYETPNPMRDTAVLNVDYAVEPLDFDPGGPGSMYYGSDTRMYFVKATAATGQWTVPSGNYEAVVKINVDF
ncbi:hypothetical protein [Deinococcus sp. Leaf326]|uniref:hypothetical protein n=1 Tax=Deinococcus sp. Leaf326 TaxID=1736338 RepID=UPI0006F52242|nr:hypothetical protein [Deinococcus sp. Leaf326]KQR17926.1 hypothetical protein ASF71_20275 [Deinococcus sp. Leaf326]